MKLLYPYNEILPNYKAHDVFLAQECDALDQINADVTLACGKGSLSVELLKKHYHLQGDFKVSYLPILRKNLGLPFSWNRPFFYACESLLSSFDVVMLSVLKQAAYHLTRKKKGVCYLYQVHELGMYPNSVRDEKKITLEQTVFSKADALITTTEALKQILIQFYHVKVPIWVIPLATSTTPLQKSCLKDRFTFAYVGQLYPEQGVDLLLKALAQTTEVNLKIIGGHPKDLLRLQALAAELHLDHRVDFLGFIPPSCVEAELNNVDGFVAPFLKEGKMSFVAHTKLIQYTAWQKPVLAPDLPVVWEHLDKGYPGLFEANNTSSLAQKLALCKDPLFYKQSVEATKKIPSFSWEKRAQRLVSSIKDL